MAHKLASLRRVARKDTWLVRLVKGCGWFLGVVLVFFVGVFVGAILTALAGR